MYNTYEHPSQTQGGSRVEYGEMNAWLNMLEDECTAEVVLEGMENMLVEDLELELLDA